MLDLELKEQLISVFSSIESPIELVYNQSEHPDQADLLEMLNEVSETCDKITVRKNETSSPVPKFHIEVDGKANGVYFTGIPGGHEFTSLIVALLNSDRKGKLPDELIQNRIKNLKGPIQIKTFISLSCENCPDVVQALNLMAILHGDFKHEMIDGAYAQEEIKALNVQGVPSVVVNNQMIHSGRIQFLDLLNKIEETFGTSGSIDVSGSRELGHFEVVVIGGGPAGSAAAIYSVRKGLKTALLAEKIGGQVQDTKGIENFISVVYTEGPQLSNQLLQHLSSYPVNIFEHRRVKNVSKQSPFKIELESGEIITAENIIVTSGAKWRELGVPGEKEYLGRGVAFCPHCDGPYYKGKSIAVIGGGNSGVEAAIDLAGIVKDVVLMEYKNQLGADKVLIDKLLSLPNVRVITNAKTQQLVGDGQKIVELEYLDRTSDERKTISLDGVFVQIGLLPNSQFIKDVVETTPFGEIVVDSKGRTSVKGIYAAGDVTTTPYKQIVIAMGEGAKVALAVFEDRMLGR